MDALKGHFAFLEYDYTRSLEQQLDILPMEASISTWSPA